VAAALRYDPRIVRRRRFLEATLALVPGLSVVGLAGCRSVRRPALIHGVKMYLNQDGLQASYPSYDALVGDLGESRVDTLFTTLYEGKTAFYDSRILPARDPAIDLERLRESARAGDVRFGAICQIFYDADTARDRPDLVPLDQHGDGTYVNWQQLVCPSDRAYRQYKLSIVKEVAETIRPDVVSLDFMRFATTWEIIPPGTAPADIRNFCFCDRCLAAFQEQAHVTIPADLEARDRKAAWILANHDAEWVAWKAGVVTSFVEQASRLVKAVDPAMQVNVHVLPWTEVTFDNAIVWNGGQDVAALAPHVDYLSPMVYHKLIGHAPDYIGELTAELARKSNTRILPSIQAAKILDEAELSADEFQRSLELALAPPSAGTLIFQWGELRVNDQASSLRRAKNAIFQAASAR